MAKLKQSLQVDGAKLSNKDPNLVITLESHPNVFIQEIGEDTITYGFNGYPEEDTVYQLNLTFTYMGLISYVAPLRITQRAIADEPTIVDVAPIDIEPDHVYQAPFRVILPISGRDITSAFGINTIEDNAGTHTDYLTKTNGLFFKVVTSDLTDYTGTFKFTITGTHEGQPVTLSADVPVTIKKWEGKEYRIEVEGGNDTPIVGIVGRTGSFNYQLFRRNLIVAATDIKGDITSLEETGKLSNVIETIADSNTRKVDFTFASGSETASSFNVLDVDDNILDTVQLMFVIDDGLGLRLLFPNLNDKDLKGNKGDIVRVSPTITLDGEAVLPTDPALKLYARVAAGGVDSSNVRVISNSASNNYWEIEILTTVASSPASFVWEVEYTDENSVNASGTVSAYADTPSAITGDIITDLFANVEQSAIIQLVQPTYGSGPNWTIVGGKLTEAVIQIFDKKTGNQVGEDTAIDDAIVATNGQVQVNLPRLPYTSSVVKITGTFLAKSGSDGSAPGYSPVTIEPVISKDVAASVLVATPTEEKFNYFNNSTTKVTFVLTQEQGDQAIPVNAVLVRDIVVTGKGFTTDTVAVKEGDDTDGVYSFNIQGMGEEGDATFTAEVQYPIGEFQTITFGLKASVIAPVVTDSPITVAMWETGDKPPFTITLAGQDVTNQITELKVSDNQYVKLDSSTGTKKVWEIMYADTVASSVLVEFTYKLVVDGVNTEYTSSGTFNLPAWDGVAFYLAPVTENDPKFSALRIKKEGSDTVGLVAYFKGKRLATSTGFDYDAENSNLNGNTITFSSGTEETGRVATITAAGDEDISDLQVVFTAVALGGYPADTDKLTKNVWSPELEVWDDKLVITPTAQDVSGVELTDIEIPVTIAFNGETVDLIDQDATYMFAPTDILEHKGYSGNTALICTVKKEVTEETELDVTLNVSYKGKTESMTLKVTVKPSLIKDYVFTDAPISTSIWQVGDELPFTVVDADGQDVKDKITKATLIPNSYVVMDEETNKLWYIQNAETIARDISTTFNLEFTVDGVVFEKQFTGTFKLAAWNGITMSMTFPESLIGASTAKETSYEVGVVYKGKPAADKLEVMSLGNLATNIEVISIAPSGDNATATVTIKGITALAIENKNNLWVVGSDIKYRIKDTAGNVEGKDLITRNGDKYFVTGDFLGIFSNGIDGVRGPVNSIRAVAYAPNSTATEFYVYKNGERVDLSDSDLEFYLLEGPEEISENDRAIGAEYISGSGTEIYFRITQPYLGENKYYYNYWGVRLNSDPIKYKCTPAAGDWDFWVRVSNEAADVANLDNSYSGIPAVANDIQVGFKVGDTVMTNPVITNATVEPIPTNGNAIILTENWSFEKDPSDQAKALFKFAAGHKGTGVRLTATLTDPTTDNKPTWLDVTIPIAISQVTAILDSESYRSDDNNQLTVKFKLTQPRFSIPSYDFAGGAFSAVSIQNADSTGRITIEDDWFVIVLEAVGGVTAKVSGTITGTDNDPFPFTFDVVIDEPVALELSEGFQGSGEGDKDHPLTLTQGAVFPTE